MTWVTVSADMGWSLPQRRVSSLLPRTWPASAWPTSASSPTPSFSISSSWSFEISQRHHPHWLRYYRCHYWYHCHFYLDHWQYWEGRAEGSRQSRIITQKERHHYLYKLVDRPGSISTCPPSLNDSVSPAVRRVGVHPGHAPPVSPAVDPHHGPVG